MLSSGPTSATSSGHAGLDDGGAIRAAVSQGDEGASLSFVIAVMVCEEEVNRALLRFYLLCCIVRLRLFSLSFSQE